MIKTFAAVVLTLASLGAHAMEPGARVEPWTLDDQFDKPYAFSSDVKVLLVARSMDAAKVVNAAMEDQPAGYLEARKVVYVADIARVPSVGRMFMVPAMKKASYRIVLDREGTVAQKYVEQNDAVTWLQLRDGVLVNQKTYTDPGALRAALERAAD